MPSFLSSYQALLVEFFPLGKRLFHFYRLCSKSAVANRLGTQCPQAKYVLAKTIIQSYQIMLGSIVNEQLSSDSKGNTLY